MRLRVFALLLLTTLAGCSMPAQNYRPFPSNVQAMRDLPTAVNVGSFSAKDGDEAKVNQISMRGSTLTSPYGSFSAYVEGALKQELSDAGKLDPASKLVVTGMLIRNSVDASGMSTGTADIEVEFTLTQEGVTRYRKTHSAHHEWSSSFAGAIALPAVQQNYHGVVQRLIDSLLSDMEFLSTLKKVQPKGRRA